MLKPLFPLFDIYSGLVLTLSSLRVIVEIFLVLPLGLQAFSFNQKLLHATNIAGK